MGKNILRINCFCFRTSLKLSRNYFLYLKSEIRLHLWGASTQISLFYKKHFINRMKLICPVKCYAWSVLEIFWSPIHNKPKQFGLIFFNEMTNGFLNFSLYFFIHRLKWRNVLKAIFSKKSKNSATIYFMLPGVSSPWRWKFTPFVSLFLSFLPYFRFLSFHFLLSFSFF